MLLKRRETEPARPKLLGEDFDIFPDLQDGQNADTHQFDADASQEDDAGDIDIDEETLFAPTDFQKKIEQIPEEKWRRYQILGGIILGIVCGLSITVLNRIEALPSLVSWLVPFGLAVYGPRFFENKARRTIPKARIALIITAALFFGLYLLYGLVIDPSMFANPA